MLATTRKPRTSPARGYARWLVGHDRVVDLLTHGEPAPLMIVSVTKGGEVRGFYWVARSFVGRGWTLRREGNDAEGQDEVRYELSRDCWCCSCPGAKHGQDGCCKHALGLKAALAKIGVS